MTKQRWGCIYKLTNKINGKYYIGKTIHFKTRMYQHKHSWKYKHTYLPNAIKKHGWNNFECEILMDDVPEEDLNNLEISYIELNDSTNRKKGYNLANGGQGTSGYKFTKDQRRKCLNNLIERHKNRKKFGCVYFSKIHKKWTAFGPRINKNALTFVGNYFTKEKAEKALHLFNTSNERMTSDVSMRRQGTGTIYKRNGKYKAEYNHTHIGVYKTGKAAEEAIKRFIRTGEKGLSRRKRGTGSIRTRRDGKYAVEFKKKYIGRYKTKQEAEDALNECIYKLTKTRQTQ